MQAPDSAVPGDTADEIPEAVRLAKERMAKDAARAFVAWNAAYKSGTCTIDNVFFWSNRLLAAELDVARTRDEQIAAAEANLARTQEIQKQVAMLYTAGSKGGEATAMSAADYHVAEAERKLAEVVWAPEAGVAPADADKREQARLGRRIVQLEERLAKLTSQADEIKERLKSDPSPDGTAKWKLERDQKSFEAQQDSLKTLMNLYRQKLKSLEASKQLRVPAPVPTPRATAPPPVSPLPTLPTVAPAPTVPQPVPPLAPNAPADLGAALWNQPLRVNVGPKTYAINDPELVPALRAALAGDDNDAQRGAIIISTIQVSPNLAGGERVGPFAELAPELIALMGGADVGLRELAQYALLCMRSKIEDTLQEAAKSENSEIAQRAKKLLAQSEPAATSTPISPTIFGAPVAIQPEPAATVPKPSPPSPAPRLRDVLTRGPYGGYAPQATPSNPYAPRVAAPVTVPSPEATRAPPTYAQPSVAVYPPALPSSPAPTYQGRTFDQWRQTLETQLDPVSRGPALAALGEFAANGYGTQVAKTIMELMQGYSCWPADVATAGQPNVAQLAQQAMKRVPPSELLPVLLKALSGNVPQPLPQGLPRSVGVKPRRRCRSNTQGIRTSGCLR